MMSPTKAQFSSSELTQLLTAMNEAGGFLLTVLTDCHGFSIASAAQANEDPDRQAAAVAFLQKTAVQVQQQLGLAQTDEVSFYDVAGRRLICRLFRAGEHDLLLAVVIPDKQQRYRRLTNSTISMIQRLWPL